MKKVLIAEDEDALMYLTTEILKINQEYVLFEAHDGEEALQMAQEIKPDLLVLDIMMPKLSGYDVAKALRNMKDRPAIIMLTASAQKEDITKGFESGADYYLTKPFSPEEFFELVKQVLQV